MEPKLIAYYIGIAIVVFSHIYLLYTGILPADQVKMHALLNLAASAMIAWYFMSG